MCAGAASSGGIAVTAPQESHSDCCPQPGSGGAPASGHPETGRKLGTHGLQIGKAVAAAPAESHPADSVLGNHRSGLAEVLTYPLNQSHEATLLSCHPEREISANQHFCRNLQGIEMTDRGKRKRLTRLHESVCDGYLLESHVLTGIFVLSAQCFIKPES